MLCKKCGAEIPDGAKFCPACGMLVSDNQPVEQPKMKYCPQCGTQIPECENTCPKCKKQEIIPDVSIAKINDNPKSPLPKKRKIWKIILGVLLLLLIIWCKPISGLVGLFAMVAIPITFIIFTILAICKKPKRIWGIAFLISVLLFIIADFSVNVDDNANHLPLHVDNSANNLSAYTYDEYIMYCTMLNGYEGILSNLKNPNADFLGISYNPDSEIAYFCVLAENDFGGRTKSYISCNRSNMIDESDDLKYYYDSCEIKRTMADLQSFMIAVENSDESDVPVNNLQEKLADFSSAEQKMYKRLISGIDAVELLYDDVVILGYKYDTSQNSAYFYFTGNEIGTGKTVLTYAHYTDYFDLYVSDSYKNFFDNADKEINFSDIASYRRAIKKDISK